MKHRLTRLLSLALALCLCAAMFCMTPVKASAETEIKKVTLVTGNGGTTPVVWMEVKNLPTKASSKGVNIASATWYTTGGKAISGKFGTEECYLVVKVTAKDGYVFADKVEAYINNSQATVVRDSDTELTITSHKYKPEIWAAVPTKHPTPETAQAGGKASFVAAGIYTQDYEWCVMTPDGKHRFTFKELREAATASKWEDTVPRDFTNIKTEGELTDKLTISNIPADMDGWKIYCRLYSVNRITWTNSNTALLTVEHPDATPAPEASPKPSEEPEPEASPEPSEEPEATPEATPEPTPEVTPEPTPEVHEHSPAEEWTTDESFHWHACQGCEEQLDKEAHEMTWSETRPASVGAEGTEEGSCIVCGYKTSRSIPALEPETKQGFDGTFGLDINGFRYAVFGIFGAVGLGLVAMIIGAIVRRARRRR